MLTELELNQSEKINKQAMSQIKEMLFYSIINRIIPLNNIPYSILSSLGVQEKVEKCIHFGCFMETQGFLLCLKEGTVDYNAVFATMSKMPDSKPYCPCSRYKTKGC